METKHVAVIVGGVLLVFVGWYILKGAVSTINMNGPKTRSIDELMTNLANPATGDANYGGDF